MSNVINTDLVGTQVRLPDGYTGIIRGVYMSGECPCVIVQEFMTGSVKTCRVFDMVVLRPARPSKKSTLGPRSVLRPARS